MCKTCDITVNNDLDKYVLKNSIKPCNKVDMSNIFLKKILNHVKLLIKNQNVQNVKNVQIVQLARNVHHVLNQLNVNKYLILKLKNILNLININ